MNSQAPILIVGAGQAGVQIAESLRQEGFGGGLLLIGEESHPPYQRPPLSKKWLADGGGGNPVSLAIRGAEALARRRIELKLEARVAAVDRRAGELTLGNGERLRYGKLAFATGSLPRTLPVPGATLQGVLYLRGIADSQAIAEAIRRCAAENQRVVVIGGGFIGLEVAAGARKLGAEVTVLEGLPRLMSRVTAPVISGAFERLHRAHGVEFVFDAQVVELRGSGDRVERVHTADGREFAAGCVVVGIGVAPDDRIAAEAGLACDRGIIVDECSRTTDPVIAAAGDCTARRLPDGRLQRLESVQNAVEQGKSAAAALMGRKRPFSATPWFWSDQYDVKLQMAGLSHGYDQVITRGDLHKPAFSAFYFCAGRLVAVDSLNRISDHMLAKRLLDHDVSPTAQQVADASFDLHGLVKQSA
ncbi:MAG TPA: FAD-dependent oxidoreductase [Steroidobacteraceae bacterium]|jgi:3-phenylpropionate/trans-cinnamate dioxygenase ferredoxin reductase subunit|nr:FAD-dependent oxidoreductase [Steroidobacteraceae bacterium]